MLSHAVKLLSANIEANQFRTRLIFQISALKLEIRDNTAVDTRLFFGHQQPFPSTLSWYEEQNTTLYNVNLMNLQIWYLAFEILNAELCNSEY